MSITERMRILEQMRWQETRLTKVLEPLRSALIHALASASPAATSLLERTELWWQDLPADAPADSASVALADVPVVKQALESIGGSSPELPSDPVSTRALAEFVAELRVLSALRAQLDPL